MKKIHETVLFECHVDNLGKKIITWYKVMGGKKKLIYAGNINIFQDPRLSAGNNGLHLAISNLKEGDDGEYFCQVNTNREDEIRLHHYLKVRVPPVIKPDPENGNINIVKVNKTATLKCIATGSPKPYITWSKSDKPEVVISRGEQILIQDVTRLDADIYECKASNGVGDDAKAQIRLEVLFPPEVHVPVHKIYTGTPSSSLGHGHHRRDILTCIIYGEPEPRVFWIGPSNNVIPSSSHNFNATRNTDPRKKEPLYYLNVLYARDHKHFGKYKCIGENTLGTAEGTIELTGAPQKPIIISDSIANSKNTYTLRWTVKSPLRLKNQKVNYWLEKTSGSYEATYSSPIYYNQDNGNSTTLHINHQQLIKAMDITTTIPNRDPDLTAYEMAIAELFPDSNYVVQIEAENAFGKSEYSDKFHFYTTILNENTRPSVQAQSVFERQ
ncbi:unnamed protein product [Lepeophtheirus salmonis]|uniref:(salmon louse) hypothetical protein n=1 Tax=Lepeophtheirus salmonis TaxID=72036 RepID=A0A7R8HCL5_LEPSM|nr:unnamed protein product [Lepeophtheirus salmonis]CAF3018279.1 unnamed protein product [Lepeophtheirus salmonis]